MLPIPPPWLCLPPSHLGIVCKHPLLSRFGVGSVKGAYCLDMRAEYTMEQIFGSFIRNLRIIVSLVIVIFSLNTFLLGINKKYTPIEWLGCISLASVRLQADSLGRTNSCACATLDTLICINYIDVASRNSLNRTLIDASTASDTRIWNFVSHNFIVFVN